MSAAASRTPLIWTTLGLLLLSSPALAATPTAIKLSGTVRDFKRAHPDFDVNPADGMGHYAANVAYTIGVDDRPDFAGGGFKVGTQWTNSGVEPIAPHLYATGSGGEGVIRLVNGPQIDNNPIIDSFDSSQGPYGGENVGPAPAFEVGSEMPEVTLPVGLPPKVDEWKRDGNGTTVLSSSVHCDKFELGNNHELQVSGNVIVLAEELFTVYNFAEVVLLPGATLEIYALKDCEITNHVEFNVNTADPSRVTIYYLGTSTFKLSNHVDLYAQIIAPFGELLLENNSDFYGSYTGLDFHIKNSGGFHADGSAGSGQMVCGVELNDNAGAANVSSDGDISSSDTFDQWYTEIFGVNLASAHAITLVRNTGGVYEYIETDFRPVDGILFGNEGESHNNNFTYEIEAEFQYEACAGQFLEFTGSDDAWIFVGGNLGIDLGGIEPGTEQVVEMDRLGLTDGEFYAVQLFYAQRHSGEASFSLRTNIELYTEQIVVQVTWPCD